MPEYQLKAVFLFNFAKFVEWPQSSFPNVGSAFTIGIIGSDPFEGRLEKTVKDKNVNGHPIVVKTVKAIAEISACHILFVSDSERKRVAEILKVADENSVLTVGEMDRFTQLGGMIQFVMESNKVRFGINDNAAKRAHLSISAKLLSVAKWVESERGN